MLADIRRSRSFLIELSTIHRSNLPHTVYLLLSMLLRAKSNLEGNKCRISLPSRRIREIFVSDIMVAQHINFGKERIIAEPKVGVECLGRCPRRGIV
jgi:hypothetical protein